MAIDPGLLHGLMMIGAWGISAIIQIASMRYLRGYLWKQSFWIHAITGTIMYLLQLGSAFFMLSKLEWRIMVNAHFWFVFPTFTLSICLVIVGIALKAIRYKLEWNTATWLTFKQFHRFFGYLFIATG